ncbi:MAG: YqaJ viral recombinase family protein [Clostridiales bacterium]|nr:YqaJ viral recombinase family protein [Clostridiales bacterium]
MLSRISTVEMSREEWLEHRRLGIGGSDAGAILGLNPYKSAFDVYADKLRLLQDRPDNEAMRQGRDFEEYVAKRFCEETGKKVHRDNSIIHNTEYPFAFANIDRAVVGERAGLECKTTKCLNMRRYKNGDFPSEYYCQCVHYMMVTGFEKWYLAVLVFGSEFLIFEIVRDDDEIEALAKAEHTFWEENVKKRIPPAPDGSKNADNVITALYRDEGGNCDLEPVRAELDKLTEVKRRIMELGTEKQRLEQIIKLFMQNNEGGECNGYRVTWRAQERAGIDVSGIIKDFVPKDTDLSKYYKNTKYRVFKVKEN